MRSIFRKALWDQRRSLPVWGSAISLFIFLEAALWPSMESMASLDEYLQDFPEPLRELFAINEMTTGRGFLNAELFTLMLPILFVVYGITHGARMVAGEEEAGTLDLLLVTPLSTTRLLVEEAMALLVGLAGLGAAALVTTVLASELFGLQVSVGAALAGALAVSLLGVEFGVVALVTGALTGRRGLAIAVSSGAASASYLLFVAGMFVDDLAAWRAVSPVHQALHAGPLAADLPASFAWLLVVPLGLVVAAVPVWARRDIGAAR